MDKKYLCIVDGKEITSFDRFVDAVDASNELVEELRGSKDYGMLSICESYGNKKCVYSRILNDSQDAIASYLNSLLERDHNNFFSEEFECNKEALVGSYGFGYTNYDADHIYFVDGNDLTKVNMSLSEIYDKCIHVTDEQSGITVLCEMYNSAD